MTRASRSCAPISSAISPSTTPSSFATPTALRESVANEADAILERMQGAFA